MKRLFQRIKLEPRLDLIPLALVDSFRGLLLCISPIILENTTAWFLLVNLELAFGYSIVKKFKIFNFNSLRSSGILIIFGTAILLCIFTKLKGVLAILIAFLSILSQMMHSKAFDMTKKQSNSYALKTEVRDSKTILVFYRCILSFSLCLFGFVIKQILEIEHIASKEVVDPSLTKKIFCIILIGVSASTVNVTIAKSLDQLFKHFFYKIIFAIVDYFVKIAIFSSAISLPILACNTFLILGYCVIYLEEITGEKDRQRQYMSGSGIDDDEDNSSLEDNTLIDFIKVIWSKKYTRRIALFFLANLGFMFVEVLYGYLTNSLGLISDALHMAFDCLALLVGLIAAYLAQGEEKEGYSYGMSRVEVLSGFFNGVFLIFIAFKVLCESVDRIYEPQLINEDGLLTVSVLGLLVNIVGLACFHDLHHHDHGDCSHGHGNEHSHSSHDHSHHDHSHNNNSHHDHSHHDHSLHDHSHHDHSLHDHSHHDHSHHDHSHSTCSSHNGHSHSHSHDHDHEHNVQPQETAGQGHNENIYGFFLHILADALGSVGVIISSLLIHYKGLYVADPICSVIISVLIFVSVIPLIMSSGNTLLLKNPSQERTDSIVKKIEAFYKVRRIALWEVEKGKEVCSVHVVVRSGVKSNEVNEKVTSVVGVKDCTVQITYFE